MPYMPFLTKTPLLGDLLELIPGISPGVEIRVVLLGQLEVGRLDVLLLRVCLKAQHLYKWLDRDDKCTVVVGGAGVQGEGSTEETGLVHSK